MFHKLLHSTLWSWWWNGKVLQSQFLNVWNNTLEIYSFFDLAKILLSDHHMCASMSSSKMQSSCNMIKMHEHVYIKYFQFLAKKIDPRKICPCLTKNILTKNFSFFAKVLLPSSWVFVYFLGHFVGFSSNKPTHGGTIF